MSTEDMTFLEKLKYHALSKAVDVFARLYGNDVVAACIWEEANQDGDFNLQRFYRTLLFRMVLPENREEVKAKYYMSLEREKEVRRVMIRHGRVGGPLN